MTSLLAASAVGFTPTVLAENLPVPVFIPVLNSSDTRLPSPSHG